MIAELWVYGRGISEVRVRFLHESGVGFVLIPPAPCTLADIGSISLALPTLPHTPSLASRFPPSVHPQFPSSLSLTFSAILASLPASLPPSSLLIPSSLPHALILPLSSLPHSRAPSLPQPPSLSPRLPRSLISSPSFDPTHPSFIRFFPLSFSIPSSFPTSTSASLDLSLPPCRFPHPFPPSSSRLLSIAFLYIRCLPPLRFLHAHSLPAFMPSCPLPALWKHKKTKAGEPTAMRQS